MMTFERERRYIVFKVADFMGDRRRILTHEEKEELAEKLAVVNRLAADIHTVRLRQGKLNPEFVVVESDWPEYEPTWDAIRRRMEGEPTREDSAYVLGREAGLREAAGIVGSLARYMSEIGEFKVNGTLVATKQNILAAIPFDHIVDANGMVPSPPNYEAVKKIAVDFFYWWHNQPGNNTADGFDEWWKLNQPSPPNIGEGCTCQGCSEKYTVDFSVPDDVWEWVKPKGKPVGAGLLCGKCIVERLVALVQWSNIGEGEQCEWSKDQPTEPGLYALRTCPDDAQVVQVKFDTAGLYVLEYGSSERYRVRDYVLTCEWKPIKLCNSTE